MSHFTWILSPFATVCSSLEPGATVLLNGSFLLAYVWMLWLTWSEFRNTTLPPAPTTRMCGSKWHIFWSIWTVSVEGSIFSPGTSMSTTTFASPPSFAMTREGSVVSIFAPGGQQFLDFSSVICIGFSSGALPSNFTWPVALPSTGGVVTVMAATQLRAAAMVRIVVVFIRVSLVLVGILFSGTRNGIGPQERIAHDPTELEGRPCPN